MHRSFKEKRGLDRISVKEEVIISHKNTFYSGIVLNLSEKGMFICTKKYFPLDSRFVVSFHKRNDRMQLYANIKRIEAANSFSDGVGVELFDPSEAYLEFLGTLKRS